MAGYRATDNYYREERNTHRQAYDLYLTNEETPLIVKKICRHYKVGVPQIKFYGNSDSGSMSFWTGKMRLSNDPSIGLVIHELGHALQGSSEMKKILKNVPHKGTSHHGLRFQSCIWHIHHWAKTRGYWQEEIKKRRDKKDSKIQQSVMEKKALESPENLLNKKIADTRKKIEKNEEAKARYEKKLKRLEKLYATKAKKANRSIGALKRSLAKYENELNKIVDLPSNEAILSL